MNPRQALSAGNSNQRVSSQSEITKEKHTPWNFPEYSLPALVPTVSRTAGWWSLPGRVGRDLDVTGQSSDPEAQQRDIPDRSMVTSKIRVTTAQSISLYVGDGVQSWTPAAHPPSWAARPGPGHPHGDTVGVRLSACLLWRTSGDILGLTQFQKNSICSGGTQHLDIIYSFKFLNH